MEILEKELNEIREALIEKERKNVLKAQAAKKKKKKNKKMIYKSDRMSLWDHA